MTRAPHGFKGISAVAPTATPPASVAFCMWTYIVNTNNADNFIEDQMVLVFFFKLQLFSIDILVVDIWGEPSEYRPDILLDGHKVAYTRMEI